MSARHRPILLAGCATVALVLGVIWAERRPMARVAIDRYLAAHGVSARYTVREIGLGTERFEDVSVGDPSRPDLVARRVDVTVRTDLSGLHVEAVRAAGVRLHGAVVGGGIHWGAVDALLPNAKAGGPALPNIALRLDDARISIATDLGTIVTRIDGGGPLLDGFRAHARTTSESIVAGSCQLRGLRLDATVTIADGRPRFAGPLAPLDVRCGPVALTRAHAGIDVVLDAALTGIEGRMLMRSPKIQAGRLALRNVALDGRISGPLLRPSARARLTAATGFAPAIEASGFSIAGSWSDNRARGIIGPMRVAFDPSRVAMVERASLRAVGTPVGPLAARLAAALHANRTGVLTASWTARQAPRGITAALENGVLALDGGAIALIPSATVRVADVVPSWSGSATLAGGGLPRVAATLSSTPDGSTRGTIITAPYAAKGALLTLAAIRLAVRRDGHAQIETSGRLDGPVPGGGVEGLALPLVIERAPSGTITVAPGCTAVNFTRLHSASIVLGPARTTLCPTAGKSLLTMDSTGMRGGAFSKRLDLHGSVGGSALSIAVDEVALAPTGSSHANGLSVRLSTPSGDTRLSVDRVSGRGGPSGFTGEFANLSGELAQVPIELDRGRGRWTLRNGMLGARAALAVRDSAPSPRFNSLVTNDADVRLLGGHVTASATLREPGSNRTVTAVSIRHALSSGIGRADLAVRDLVFDKKLQPEALTPLTVGIVANVRGTVNGDGHIEWTPKDLTSGGRFETKGLDLAAAFGPVGGLKGAIVFDDLLALRTPPGQRVTIHNVNPGVEVADGTIDFQLLPAQQVVVEGGRWPFAGGRLLLDPTMLDFGRTSEHKFAFRVEGIDAAKFIEMLKLQDISATGVFDGALPIVFDAADGRIIRGRVVARPGGGTLAYVGDASNVQTNYFAKLAFDALKSMRYQNLTIDLDGALDGEIVSQVRFTGTNQSPVAATGLARSLTGLPFRFNITIRAPFRGLINSARGLQDPGSLLAQPVQPGVTGPQR